MFYILLHTRFAIGICLDFWYNKYDGNVMGVYRHLPVENHQRF